MTGAYTDIGAPALPGLDVTGPSANVRDAETAARELAGVFYSMMLKEMQKTVPENPFTGGRGEEVFRSMWINEMGRALAWRRGDALSEAIVDDISGESRAVQGG